MKLMVQRTSITGRKTNHSARKTMVETLCHANIPDSIVMQLSGHKSVQSLNHYKKPSLEQQKSISHLLSSHTATEQSCAQPVIPSPFGSLAASSNSPVTVHSARVTHPFQTLLFQTVRLFSTSAVDRLSSCHLTVSLSPLPALALTQLVQLAWLFTIPAMKTSKN